MERAQPTRIVQASPEAIEAARAVLAAGGLVAFPTETVYGLGADATNDAAVARLYAAKERPSFNPLIAHVAEREDARRIAIFDDVALDLARAFWPGPLTLVLPSIAGSSASGTVGALARAGLDTVAVRVPRHPVAHALVKAFGRPVAAPSANRSGGVSPTSAAHVSADLNGRIDLIIDGGPTVIGLEIDNSFLRWRCEAPTARRPAARGHRAMSWPCDRCAGRAFPGRLRASSRDARLPLRAARNASHRCAIGSGRGGAVGFRPGPPRTGGACTGGAEPVHQGARSRRRRPTCLPTCAHSMPPGLIPSPRCLFRNMDLAPPSTTGYAGPRRRAGESPRDETANALRRGS